MLVQDEFFFFFFLVTPNFEQLLRFRKDMFEVGRKLDFEVRMTMRKSHLFRIIAKHMVDNVFNEEVLSQLPANSAELSQA